MAFFLVLIVGINLTFLSIFRHVEQQQIRQLHSALREKIIASDIGAAKEYLSRLRPAFIVEYELFLEGAPVSELKNFTAIQFYFDVEQTKLAGTALIRLNHTPQLWSLIAINLIVGGLFLLGGWLIRREAEHEIHIQAAAFDHFLNYLENILKKDNEPLKSSAFPSIQQHKIAALVSESVQSRIKFEKQAAIGSLAAQVAHDIRSPLAALDSMVNRLAQLPEQERVFMRAAINRIKDIANNLLQKNRDRVVGSSGIGDGREAASNEALSIQFISSLLEPLITEKRIQYRSKIGIEIDGRIDASSYGLFANIQATEFKRVFSNLINNAVEVLGEKGSVVLSVVGRKNEVEIIVRDNGRGISPEVLAKLGQRGETHGKDGGSGLGLYHAKKSVESWGGCIRIVSQVGKGTSVSAVIPLAPPPEWFVSELTVVPKTTIVVLDDDSSIHQIWRGRFESLRVSESQIEVVHLSTPTQLRNWVSESSVASKRAIYLADYELLGFQDTGLSLIEELGLGAQSILVTSRFEESQILENCQRLKVRLIPKSLAAFVPVSLGQAHEPLDVILTNDSEPVARSIFTSTNTVSQSAPRVRYDLCLIDDDTILIHPVWASVAHSKGLNIRLFASPHEFLLAASTIDLLTPIYIDVSLGPNISGVEFAHEVFRLGFTEINLATGYEPESIKIPSFIRRIVGKDFPEFTK